MTADPIERVRLFMQTCAEARTRWGPGSWPYPVTVMRVITEIAKREHVQVSSLRSLLSIDAGYLSRILARLELDGIVVRQRSTVDKRALLVGSTPRCTLLAAAYRTSMEKPIHTLLASLDTVSRQQLLDAVDVVQAQLEHHLRQPTR